MTRRTRWAAVQVPWLRRALVDTARAEAARMAEQIERADRLGRPDLRAEVESLRDRYARFADRMRGAQLFWVTRAMAAVAMDAALDVPTLDPGDAPDRDGLIVFERPLPPYPVAGMGGLALRDGTRTDVPHNDPVPLDALAWMLGAGRLTVGLCCRAERLPLPLSPNDGDLVEFASLTTPTPVRLDESVPVLSTEGVTPAGHARGVLSLLSACWVLMMTPTVAQRRTLDTRGSTGEGRAPTPERDVTIVDLRPIRQVHTDVDETTGRKLTTRHYVRGHWTNQPYGPGRSLRRLQWVAPYIRGPEGAPLVQREQVMVWRR